MKLCGFTFNKSRDVHAKNSFSRIHLRFILIFFFQKTFLEIMYELPDSGFGLSTTVADPL